MFFCSSSDKDETSKHDLTSQPDLMSSDMYREKLREKWEQETQEALDKPAGPTHYADVQFDGKWNQLSLPRKTKKLLHVLPFSFVTSWAQAKTTETA